jgi:hypothetical protein
VATRRRRDNHYDLDMNDIHQLPLSGCRTNPDQHQILILKTRSHHAFNLFQNNPIPAEASAVLQN